jgi:hypothetical protein
LPSADSSCNTLSDTFGRPGSQPHGNTNIGSQTDGIMTRIAYGARLADVTDGLSNVILIGEILPECHDHGGGGWPNYNAMNTAHAGMITQPNDFTTCPNIPGGSNKPKCAAQNNWTYSWGFRSRHTGGVQVLLGDGTVRFISASINGATWRNLGGKSDGQILGDF